jgi:cytochrome P450
MILAPAYKEIMGLGKYYWQATKTRAEQGVTGSQDLIDVMMQTKDEKRGLEFSTKELWLEVFLLGAVGKSTSQLKNPASRERRTTTLIPDPGSTSIGPFISAIFSLLLHSPTKLNRLTTEIRSLSSSSEIRIDGQLDHCSYLWASIDELFRLMPVINNALFRTVQKGGVIINNTFYPEGTDLGSSIFEINRNEKYFAEPHEFKPERYLEGTEEERKEAKKYWVPFGRGNRTCVGQTLAYVITVQTVARVIWEYDVRLAPESCCGSVPEEELASHHNFDSFIGIRTSGPLIQVRKR